MTVVFQKHFNDGHMTFVHSNMQWSLSPSVTSVHVRPVLC